MHPIRFRLRQRSRPRWGSSQHTPNLQLDFRGPTSKKKTKG